MRTAVGNPREEVQWFAHRMEEKLRANDHKPHWSSCRMDYLLQRLYQEASELWRAIQQGQQPEDIICEAADVANFAMMIADNIRRINIPEREQKMSQMASFTIRCESCGEVLSLSEGTRNRDSEKIRFGTDRIEEEPFIICYSCGNGLEATNHWEFDIEHEDWGYTVEVWRGVNLDDQDR